MQSPSCRIGEGAAGSVVQCGQQEGVAVQESHSRRGLYVAAHYGRLQELGCIVQCRTPTVGGDLYCNVRWVTYCSAAGWVVQCKAGWVA